MIEQINQFKIEVIRKNIKNMYFKLKPNNVLLVSCNYLVSDEEINTHIQKNLKRIIKKYQKLNHKSINTMIGIIDKNIYFLGKKYKLKVEYGNPKLFIEDDQIIIKNRSLEDDDVLKTFYKLCKPHLNNLVLNKQEEYIGYIKKYRNINNINYKYSIMKSLWGSCQPKKIIIHLNSKLIHFDHHIIESILAHELIHLMVANHSKDFYYHLLNIDLLYFENMKYLKNHSN